MDLYIIHTQDKNFLGYLVVTPETTWSFGLPINIDAVKNKGIEFFWSANNFYFQ